MLNSYRGHDDYYLWHDDMDYTLLRPSSLLALLHSPSIDDVAVAFLQTMQLTQLRRQLAVAGPYCSCECGE